MIRPSRSATRAETVHQCASVAEFATLQRIGIFGYHSVLVSHYVLHRPSLYQPYGHVKYRKKLNVLVLTIKEQLA